MQIQTDKEHTGTAESTIRTEPHPQRQQKNLSRRDIHISNLFFSFSFFGFRQQNKKKKGDEKKRKEKKVQISNRPVGSIIVGVSNCLRTEKPRKVESFHPESSAVKGRDGTRRKINKKKKKKRERRSELHVPTHSHPGD